MSERPEPSPVIDAGPRTGLYRRFFAWLLSRVKEHYGKEVDERKHAMLSSVHGTVVEIGAGAGANLRFYPPGIRLLSVEPNIHMRPYLEAEAKRHGVDVGFCDGTAERMEVADGAADFVVCTLVLCSVDDPQGALVEVMRVLKPGGRFLFLEHVAAPRGSRLRRWQRRLRPLWRRIVDGCTLDRETGATIESAGFENCEIERFEAETVPLARPHIAGVATKEGSPSACDRSSQ